MTANGQTRRVGTCPQCGADLDPLRAPAYAIAGDTVVAVCSEECRQAYLAAFADEMDRSGGRHGAGYGAGFGAGHKAHHGASGLFAKISHWWSGSKTSLLVVAALGLAAGVLAMGYRFACLAKGDDAVSRIQPTAEASGPPVPPPEPVSVQPEKPKMPGMEVLRKQAQAILERFMAAGPTRHQILAAEVLACCCNEPEAWKILHDACRDRFWPRRKAAAEALMRLGKEQGVEVLRDGLRSHRRSERWSAAFVLARHGNRSGIKILHRLLGLRRYRLTTAEALVHLKDGRARRALVAIAQSSEARSTDRIRAAAALVAAGDQDARGLLASLTKDGPPFWPSVMVLVRSGDVQARSKMAGALKHTALRVEAARALVAAGVRVDPAPLWQDLSAPDDEAKVSAAAALLLGGCRRHSEAP
ncbi:MAG: hypothetical protein J7M25_12400 [Deltaproteobacteria bacterium]|nr:hypothetical protein [Deltaproteobacteria bacterium]